MTRKSSEPPSFMDQVMEICDRILDQQPGLAQTNDHKREQHDSPAELPNARRPLS